MQSPAFLLFGQKASTDSENVQENYCIPLAGIYFLGGLNDVGHSE